ncbi:flagellar motor switch protein FliM [Neobacillus sp. 114]|uniref:flagellar motor switch protein FliM n=1 Tax=Neobacillus sp. 114 TaxID=3048535 RepID=UPI0024C4002B|nr:flagellar motor switch protein FliM [Neobacillus sp. 114]
MTYRRGTALQNDQTDLNGTSSIMTYDFKKALRLSVDQVRALTKIHENFAYQFSSNISVQLRTMFQVEVISVEQILYQEFVKLLPNNTIISVFEAGKQEIRMAMDLNPRMAFSMIDRLLGGKGSTEVSERFSITPIENNVLKRFFEGVAQSLQKAWSDIVTLRLKVVELETNPQYLQLSVPTETVIVIVFNVKLGNDVEPMHLCIPYTLLEPFIPKLTSHNWFGKNNGQIGKNKEENGLLQERLEHLTVPVSAELGRAKITIEEFLGLSVNDVLQLDQLVEEPLQIKINEQTKFLAHPGTKKSRLAVKIKHVIEGEDQHDG